MNAPDPVLSLVRPEILALTPYSSARKESSGGRVWLDANENPLTPHADAPRLNRYPEPQPADLVARFASLYGVTPDRVLVTRGSDEGIDLLLRAFCSAGRDAILITPPTYGMYTVSATIQGAQVVRVPLVREKDFALDAAAVLAAALNPPVPDPVRASLDSSFSPAPTAACPVKLVFLCSPNNPTGQLLDREAVLSITRSLLGRAVVVVDEAYAEFAAAPSLAADLSANPNLVVLRTLSKAYGLAGARVGVTLGSPAVIGVLQKIIAPYPIPVPVLHAALAALTGSAIADARRYAQTLVLERQRVAAALPAFRVVKQVWPSDANFLLVEVTDAAKVMAAGRAAGVIWRDRTKDVPNTVRLTIGTAEENDLTLEVLSNL